VLLSTLRAKPGRGYAELIAAGLDTGVIRALVPRMMTQINALPSANKSKFLAQYAGQGGVTAMARGGILTQPTAVLGGEAGVPEAWIPFDGSSRSRGLLARSAAAMGYRLTRRRAPGGPRGRPHRQRPPVRGEADVGRAGDGRGPAHAAHRLRQGGIVYEPGMDLGGLQATLGSLPLGSVDEAGVAWVLQDVQGWDSSESRGEFQQREADHGAWATPGYLGERPITLAGVIVAPDRTALDDAMERAREAASLSDTLLVVRESVPK
ncbi:hypothetical protein, partial [Bacillus mobilis]|uniref:hypothetical protein n=1 Tax=Bacillus mobilis TaxID=2026190 RepID=UPI00366DA0D8